MYCHAVLSPRLHVLCQAYTANAVKLKAIAMLEVSLKCRGMGTRVFNQSHSPIFRLMPSCSVWVPLRFPGLLMSMLPQLLPGTDAAVVDDDVDAVVVVACCSCCHRV